MGYSIGDVVNVLDYGSRVAGQKYILQFYGAQFSLTSELPFNIVHEFNETDYYVCNAKYTNVEWKIIDYTICFDGVMLRLRTRNKEDMLFLYRKGDASLHLVRKSKKETFEDNIWGKTY